MIGASFDAACGLTRYVAEGLSGSQRQKRPDFGFKTRLPILVAISSQITPKQVGQMIKKRHFQLLAFSLMMTVASMYGPEAAANAALIEQATSAAEQGDIEGAVIANEQLSLLYGEEPAWVGEALEAAGALDEDGEETLMILLELAAEERAASEAGDVEAALAAKLDAQEIAMELLGPGHSITIELTTELAAFYMANGAGDHALDAYNLAEELAIKAFGKGHPKTAQQIFNTSNLLELSGAEEYFEVAQIKRDQIAESLAESMGPLNPQTLRYRILAGRTFLLFSEYEVALEIIAEVCDDVERGYGTYHGQFANCLYEMATLQLELGFLSDAERTLLQISERMYYTNPGINDFNLDVLLALADVYRQQGRYQEGNNVLSSVTELALIAGETESLIAAKNYQGTTFSVLGELDKSEEVLTDVWEYGLRHWSDNRELMSSFYNVQLSLGDVYRRRGNLVDAEALLEDAQRQLNRLYGERFVPSIIATNSLGQLYEQIGLYDAAEPLLKQAVTNLEYAFGLEHLDTIAARNNLALLYESQGNFREAEPLYQTSISTYEELLGPEHPDTIAIKNNLAFLYMLMEEYEQSTDMFMDVQASWEGTLGAENPSTLSATNNLGRSLQKMGDLEVAAELVSGALATRQRTLGDGHPDVIRSLIDLGSIQLELGNVDEARALLGDALEKAEMVLGNLHPYTFEALNLLADVLAAKDNLQAAVDLKEIGFQRRSQFLDRMLWATGENAREGYLRLHRPELNRYLSMIAELNDDTSGRRLIDASLQRKGLLLKVTSEMQQIATLALDPELKSLTEELVKARQELASLTLSGPTAETGENHAAFLNDLGQRVNELQGELGRASARYRTSIAAVSTSRLENYLAEGSALIDFLSHEDGENKEILAGIAIKEDGEVFYELLRYADRDALEEAVIEYRTYIQDDLAEDDEILEVGQIAYEAVWAPIAEIIDDIEYVYMIPDGVLNILPFNALVSYDEEYVLETNVLHMLTSARDLLPNELRVADGEYVILAGPDYDSEDVVSTEEIELAKGKRSTAAQLGLRGSGGGLRGLNFAPLPGAAEEGHIINEQVEKSAQTSKTYFGEVAQERVLGEMHNAPEILHIATHGFFLEADDNLRKRLLKLQRGADSHIPPPGDNPLLRAGLAFAGINTNAQFLGDIDTKNDGVLTALEVLDLNLSGTKLVVLSACETGLGEIHEGEGVYGLRRSFQEAGVAEVVSSLWEVSDAGTQALMTDFYDRVVAGMPAREALRETQLEMMDSPEWGYPYIWSAFMITGSFESA